MTVGIDGGYVRAAHKQGLFRSDRRTERSCLPEGGSRASAAGEILRFRQTYDQKTAATGLGGDEVTRDAGEPAGGVHVR
jgi:hypothetical protein